MLPSKQGLEDSVNGLALLKIEIVFCPSEQEHLPNMGQRSNLD